MTDIELRRSLDCVTRAAQRAAHADVPEEMHSLGRRRLLAAALTMTRTEPRWRPRPWVLGLCAAAAVLLAVGAGALIRERPLTYEIHGSQPLAANYVEPQRGAAAWVDFSDGSEIAAAAGSRLRIDSTQVNGARVFVEHGTAHARVTHRASSN